MNAFKEAGMRLTTDINGSNLTADTREVLMTPGGKQPGKREKQEQEIEYKKEKESRYYLDIVILPAFGRLTN